MKIENVKNGNYNSMIIYTKKVRRNLELKERGYNSYKHLKHEEIKAQRKKALKDQAKKREAARQSTAAIRKLRKEQNKNKEA